VAVHPIVRALLRQRAAGFEDVRGSEVAATLPVSERLLNELIRSAIPPSAPVRDLYVAAEAGDRFVVRARVGSSALIPALKIPVRIERQPQFPSSPVLVLRLELGALGLLAAPALRFFNALPAGIHLENDRLFVDLSRLARERGFAEYLEFVQRLEVHTTAAAVVVSIRGGIPPSA
jgi:hypothetical protein